MLNTNLLSHLAITKACLPFMIEKKRGTFVNVISVAGMLGVSHRTLYCASKFGTSGFFKSLRSEVKQYGVNIVNVYPEFVRTNVSKNALLGSGKTFGKTDANIANGITVERAVDVILRGTALGEHELIVGRLIYHILPYLCFFSSTLSAIVGDQSYKISIKAINKSK
jgi:short-subunit dehydrogenase